MYTYWSAQTNKKRNQGEVAVHTATYPPPANYTDMHTHTCAHCHTRARTHTHTHTHARTHTYTHARTKVVLERENALSVG